MQATGNTGTLEGLVGTISAADGHETGHLNLGELDLAAAKGSQGLEAMNENCDHDRGLDGGVRTMSATLNFWAGAAMVVCGEDTRDAMVRHSQTDSEKSEKNREREMAYREKGGGG